MQVRLLVSVLVALGCATTKLPAQNSPSYSTHIRPFLATYCLECHNSGKAKAGLALDSFMNLARGSNSGPVIVPGRPDESLLLLTVEHQVRPTMPPQKAPQPRPEEVALLRAWIAAGARDDTLPGDALRADAVPGNPLLIPGQFEADGRQVFKKDKNNEKHLGKRQGKGPKLDKRDPLEKKQRELEKKMAENASEKEILKLMRELQKKANERSRR